MFGRQAHAHLHASGLSLLLFSQCALAGCLPDLGEGDIERARSVVYTADLDGFPAYEGQALLHRSCGAGVFCHSEAATASLRNGAPINLSFDLDLASDAESTELLRRGQREVVDNARHIMATIEGESMPPGEVGETIRSAGPVYRELPEIDTPEGADILRNWLASGAPVVERVRSDRPTGVEPVGAIEPAVPFCEHTMCGVDCADTNSDRNHCGGCGMPCDDDDLCSVGACVPCAGMVSFSADVLPVFEEYGCSVTGCHAAETPDETPEAGLDLSPAAAYASLVDMPATCMDGRNLVVGGLVSGSYLMNKLLGVGMCDGRRMPLGTTTGIPASDLHIIEAWICGGAADD
jgi:hypothetical protein